jgi:hypothetical protein
MTPKWTVDGIRADIQAMRLSFPAQAPVFPNLHRPDIHWRVALLYFICQWPAVAIAKRYSIGKKRVLQMIRQWTVRAIDHGYIAHIPAKEECLGNDGLGEGSVSTVSRLTRL